MLRKSLALLFCLTVLSGFSQNHDPSEGQIFEKPLARAKLGLKLSATPFPISGFDKVTQAYFDQGIAALHGFWTFESERNFREAITRMPEHPVPLAFAAFAQKVFGSGDMERGAEYLKLSQEKRATYTGTLTPAEDDWLAAIAVLYDDSLKEEERTKEHLSRLEKVIGSSADAAVIRETKAFYALQLWVHSIAGKLNAPRPLREQADIFIEDVLADLPGHPAHHYKIHLWNNGTDDILARRSALVCGKENAACAHLWHMPSHIFSILHEYRLAAFNFEAAHRVDTDYLNTHGLPGFTNHNFAHNAAYEMMLLDLNAGVMEALDLGKEMLSQPRAFHQKAAQSDPVDQVGSVFITLLENHLLWSQVRDLHQKGYLDGILTRDSDAVAQASLLRLITLAYLDAKDRSTAEVYLARLRAHRAKTAALTQPEARSWLGDVARKEKDTAYWFAIGDLAPGTVPDFYLTSMQLLGVTPLHRLALLAHLEGKAKLATTLIEEAISKDPSSVMPGAVQTRILLDSGDEAAAISQWKSVRPLIHHWLPLSPDVRKTFPFASTLPFRNEREFEKSAADSQPGLAEWEKTIGGGKSIFSYGPRHWRAPSINQKTLAKQLAAAPTKSLKAPWSDLGKSQWRLVVFRLGPTCDRCNKAEADFLNDHLDKFRTVGIDTLIVASEGTGVPKYASEHEVSVAIDTSFDIARAFGIFDEFSKAPSHAVALLDDNYRIRWIQRPDHAFEQWQGLLAEARRQRAHR